MINEERILKQYHEMIKINSVNGNEKELGEYIAQKLKDLGLTPTIEYFEEEKKRPSLYTLLDSQKPGPTLMLIGHIDTVKVANGWNTDPFVPTIIEEKTYGLGAMDMKGGLAAILETLHFYKGNPNSFTGKILAVFVSDEEDLSQGTYKLIERGLQADMAIMAECRFDNVAIGFRGRYSIEVSVSGKAAHASKYPFVGENALINASKLAIAIEALPTQIHKDMGTGTWCVRSIEGGVKNALIVPDQCELFVDRYVVPGETIESCIAQIQEAAELLGLKEKVAIRLKPRPLPYMQAFAMESTHELVVSLQKIYKEVVGKELRCEFDRSVCDSNILANELKIPVITFGPSGGNMHGANEFGVFSQVLNCTKIYIQMVEKMTKRA